MSNLVIVESPAKCSKIQGFLGSEFRVIASMGHIRALEEDLDAVGISRDFEPRFHFLKDKMKAITQLKEAGSRATKIYLAADDDREGEAIAYSVCLLLKQDPKTCARSVFHEITKTAVQKAIQEPRRLDMNRVWAQQSRAVLDMLIGFTMSPLLWKSVGPGLSAGRCQTPALRLVSEREKAIQDFKTSVSWKVHGSFMSGEFEFEAELDSELEDEESARNYMENHSVKPFTKGVINSAKTSPWSESPPLPLITSSLQQQASTLFRSNPKQTMSAAQRLYEAGHITYMRTDSAVLCDDAIAAAKAMVLSKYGEEYVGSSQKKKIKIKKEKADVLQKPEAQEAHEAIRPTHFETIELPLNEDWSSVDRKIYRLIWLRSVQSVMSAVRGEQRTIHFIMNGDEDFVWKSTWRKTVFEGFRKADTKETVSEEAEKTADSEAEAWLSAEALALKDSVEWTKLQSEPHLTRAPQRFNEASLIRELESRGIGRPSTFASLISTIIDKKYVDKKDFESRTVDMLQLTYTEHGQSKPHEEVRQQRLGGEKDRLSPSSLGQSVIQYLLSNFHDLFEYTFTATMESRLDKIASGSEEWKGVLRDTWSSYKDKYESLKSETTIVNSDRRRELGEGIVAIQRFKEGPILLKESPDGDKDKTVFYGYPSAIPFKDITLKVAKEYIEKEAKAKEGILLGEHEGKPILIKAGPYGKYVEWTFIKIPYKNEDLDMVIGKLDEKKTSAASGKIIGDFEVRKGPYGLYMFKHTLSGKARKFVSVPDKVNLEEITESALIAIYQMGLKSKAKASTYASGKYKKVNT